MTFLLLILCNLSVTQPFSYNTALVLQTLGGKKAENALCLASRNHSKQLKPL